MKHIYCLQSILLAVLTFFALAIERGYAENLSAKEKCQIYRDAVDSVFTERNRLWRTGYNKSITQKSYDKKKLDTQLETFVEETNESIKSETGSDFSFTANKIYPANKDKYQAEAERRCCLAHAWEINHFVRKKKDPLSVQYDIKAKPSIRNILKQNEDLAFIAYTEPRNSNAQQIEMQGTENPIRDTIFVRLIASDRLPSGPYKTQTLWESGFYQNKRNSQLYDFSEVEESSKTSYLNRALYPHKRKENLAYKGDSFNVYFPEKVFCSCGFTGRLIELSWGETNLNDPMHFKKLECYAPNRLLHTKPGHH